MLRLLLLVAVIAVTPAWASHRGKGETPGRLKVENGQGYSLRNGKLVDTNLIPTMAVQDHYSKGVAAFEAENWREAAKQFKVVVINFPDSPFEHEARYFLGVSLFQVKEYEFADDALTQYLLDQRDLPHFEEAARYKLAVAEAFRNGARKRFLGLSKMPRLFTSTKTAIKIYDELITMMPGHEIAAQAMLAKGHVQLAQGDFNDARDTFYLLTRRFPTNPLAAEAYASISRTFAKQVCSETNNPDILPLALINLRRFEEQFPGHPTLNDAQTAVGEIREVLATALFETARFYERVGQPRASAIYYLKTLQDFPETAIASQCRGRLDSLQEHVAELTHPAKEAAA